MSRYKHLTDLLKICSVLPALAVMPAFAEDAVLNNDNLAQDNQIYSGTIENQYATNTNRGGAVTIDYSTNDVSVADNAIFQNNEVQASTAGGAIKALNGFNIGKIQPYKLVKMLCSKTTLPGWAGQLVWNTEI